MARFIVGFVIGAAASAAVVFFTAPRSGTAQRQQLKSLWDGALEIGREASEARTRELWADYHARVSSKPITRLNDV